ncbi:uncharacterized protein LOC112498237 [Citrus sinensis]|uniref:uncharacterized protein LOC112498237 n=1 Tax=Citrus sinensis TaxID=2711 RepID=UPI0022782A99|nr:uncharacterized protein LOC112498237 [Citrus sinensis]
MAHGSLSLSLFNHPHGSLSLSLIIHSLTCSPSRDASSRPPTTALSGDDTQRLISIGGKDPQLQIHNPLSSRQPILSRCQAISAVHLRKIESQKLKEEGVNVDETVEMNSRLASGLLSELIPTMENNSDKGNHLSRCSVLRFSNIVSSLSIEQQDAMREIGFGSLLGLKCGRLRQDLCRLLVKQCNVDKRSITVHGMEYKLTPKTFTSVMGVGDGGTPIVLGGEDSEITYLRAKYCSGKKGIPIGSLDDKLKTNSCADEDLCILFSLFVIGTILCPPTAAYINPLYIYALKDVSNIRGKNWANWSFNFLWDEVSKFNKNKISSMNGCVIFLMLFYMSSTKFQLSSVAENGCPLSAWTDSEIKRFLKWRQN